jgi:hypothetical protein
MVLSIFCLSLIVPGINTINFLMGYLRNTRTTIVKRIIKMEYG